MGEMATLNRFPFQQNMYRRNQWKNLLLFLMGQIEPRRGRSLIPYLTDS